MPAQPPFCLAMLLCDGVHVDSLTGRVAILGSSDEFSSSRYPLRLPQLLIYAELSGARGRCELSAELLQIEAASLDRRILARAVIPVEHTKPERTFRVQFRFSDLELPEPGEYAIELKADGTYVEERTLLALRDRWIPE